MSASLLVWPEFSENVIKWKSTCQKWSEKPRRPPRPRYPASLVIILFAQSLSHQLDEPFFVRVKTKESFSVTAQIPWIHYLKWFWGKVLVFSLTQQHVYLSAELAATYLFSFLLRLAAVPCATWHSLSTSAHCLVNAMRRHGFLSHVASVKHYEAVSFSVFIIVFPFLMCKITHFWFI